MNNLLEHTGHKESSIRLAVGVLQLGLYKLRNLRNTTEGDLRVFGNITEKTIEFGF